MFIYRISRVFMHSMKWIIHKFNTWKKHLQGGTWMRARLCTKWCNQAAYSCWFWGRHQSQEFRHNTRFYFGPRTSIVRCRTTLAYPSQYRFLACFGHLCTGHHPPRCPPSGYHKAIHIVRSIFHLHRSPLCISTCSCRWLCSLQCMRSHHLYQWFRC